mgnify:CR=1 FL=1
MKNHNLKFHIVGIILAIFFLLPFYWIVISLTKNSGQLYQGTFFFGIPSHFIDNIIGVFAYKNGVFVNWIGNSFLYAGVGSLAGTFFAALAGFAFRRYQFVGKKILFIIILGFSMVPGFATTLPLFIVFKNLDWLNTYWSIIVPSVVNIFGVYLMVIYWNQIPEEIFDAARIDGAGDAFLFFRIGLPNLLPGFTTLLLLSFVGIWNNYFLPLVMLSSSDKMPLVLGITTILSLQGFPVYNLTIMGAFLTALPLLILFFAFQRFLVPQLTGAIK